MNAIDRAVVVTEASSGIGEATELHLDELGKVVGETLTTAKPIPTLCSARALGR